MDHPNAKQTEATIARELNVGVHQVRAAIGLIDEGATVPFIARYRKEVTGNLDDTQLRMLEERLVYLRELEARRVQVRASIDSQGKLDAALDAALAGAASKQELEDLYLPYKQKRRTRAQIAREAGLLPLADLLFGDRTLDPRQVALPFLALDVEGDLKVPDIDAALNGARDILAERFAEDASLLKRLRQCLTEDGQLASSKAASDHADAEKFRDYFDFAEPLSSLPSHRILALLRGRTLGILALKIRVDGESDERNAPHPLELRLASWLDRAPTGAPGDAWFAQVMRWTWRVKFAPALENDLLSVLRERAEIAAIDVFAANLKELLLAPPAGPRVVLGVDPGIRTGCKLAVVDVTGKVLDTSTIYPLQPRMDIEGSMRALRQLIDRHGVSLVAIGNGTGSRETDALVKTTLAGLPAEQRVEKVLVSEAGASVYSASELAAREFPDMDVSLRGAVSIARRLQDPLAELVKIEPKAIGVGQYQHDVDQRNLLKKLDAVVEDCVNAVGVDVNTASVPLLARVSGLNAVLARQIVDYRDANGRFEAREKLLSVPRLGAKTFEQAAGFLRINDGANPLDRSAVHPEAYPLVEEILKKIGKPLVAVLGQVGALQSLDVKSLTDARFGALTVKDVLAELEKPGRDPRGQFKAAQFDDAVQTMSDLKVGMMLEGVVTNVTAFGAFVDVGVHQDGLVHVSALADRFVTDPHQVVKPGQIVKVRVMEVDLPRKRIALSMKSKNDLPRTSPSPTPSGGKRAQRAPKADDGRGENAMALAFAKLRR